MESYKQLFKYKDFMRSAVSSMLNSFGDGFDGLAVSLLVYSITGSKFWFAINFGINALPNLIIQPFIGPVIEKMDRMKVMIIADLFRGALVILLVMLNVFTDLSPWLVLFFTFTITCAEAFRIPAGVVLTPSLVEREDLESATSFKQSISLLTQVISTALAGIVIASFSINTALVIDALCFCLSALVLSKIQTELLQGSSRDKSYKENLKEGFQYFTRHEFLLAFAVFGSLTTVLLTGFNVMITPYLLEVLHFDAAMLSLFNTVLLIFMLLGSVSFVSIVKKFESKTIFAGGVLFLGLFMILIAVNTSLINSLVAAAGAGFTIGLFQTSLSTLFVTSVDPEYLSRAGALFNTASFAATPIGSLLISVVMINISFKNAFVSYGIILSIISIIFTVYLRMRRGAVVNEIHNKV